MKRKRRRQGERLVIVADELAEFTDADYRYFRDRARRKRAAYIRDRAQCPLCGERLRQSTHPQRQGLIIWHGEHYYSLSALDRRRMPEGLLQLRLAIWLEELHRQQQESNFQQAGLDIA